MGEQKKYNKHIPMYVIKMTHATYALLRGFAWDSS